MTKQQLELIKQMQESGVSNKVIASFLKIPYGTYMKKLKHYETNI